MKLFTRRQQQTLSRSASVSGIGLFHGGDVRLELCPADTDHGLVFERRDLTHPVRIPAHINFVLPQARCTLISRDGASVSVIEHVLAALAGLQVDNCLIRIDGPEPPIGDGSALPFVEAILAAGIVSQDAPRRAVRVEQTLLHTETERVGIAIQPAHGGELSIGYVLDYGEGPIPPQSLNFVVTPEAFQQELADCRTFVLESEVQALQAQGLCPRATTENAMVFGPKGIIQNSLRRPDECVRHKILDCVGDFALLGYDLIGRFTATRTGHRHNHEIIRLVRSALHGLPTPRRAGLARPTHNRSLATESSGRAASAGLRAG